MNKTLANKLELAEKKARIRDLKIEREREINLKIIDEQERKANALGFGIYKIKKNSRIPFIQIIDKNIEELLKNDYISFNDLGFLSAISSYIEISTNALKNPETNQFMKITELAYLLNQPRETVSRKIQKLIKKGIIFELVSAKELKMHKRITTERPLFINPEIMYKGDKNKITPMLCDIVRKYDLIEENNIHLPYKVWHDPNEKYGKLYSHKYLKNIKQKL